MNDSSGRMSSKVLHCSGILLLLTFTLLAQSAWAQRIGSLLPDKPQRSKASSDERQAAIGPPSLKLSLPSPAKFDATVPPSAGGHSYYFPHLAVGASWQTTLTYINYSPQEVSCRTEFLSDQGTPLMVSFPALGPVVRRTDVMPPGGSVHQETNVGLSAPLAPGWARASCSGPVKASLLFRRYNSEGVPTAEAGVNATTVPATRFVTFAEQGEGQFGTGVAYANPSDTEADVTFTAKDAAGQTLASTNHNLPPGGHGAQNMVDLFGLTSFIGSLQVTSTEPIVSLSLNFEADPVFSFLPPGELDPSAEGSVTYYFPHLAVGASWQTTITYINYASEEVSCQTDFLSDDGSPLMVSFAGLGTVVSRTDVLPPGGSVHQETNVDLSAPLAPGWSWANCSGAVKASLLFRRYDSEGVPTGEASVNAAAVPAARFVTFAEQGEGQFGTGVAYANPSSAAADLSFTARDAAGQTLASVNHNLLPGGHGSQNMVDLFGLTSFSGSLEVTSTEPIISLSLNFEADPVFSSLPPGELDPSEIPGEIPPSDKPDLVVEAPSVNPGSPSAGEAFTLSVTVRNQGNGASNSTTLRYYRSSDAAISTADTEVGTDTVGGLSASGADDALISLTAPSTAGTYYYGACVDSVSGESDTGNNCSDSTTVTVQLSSAGVTIPHANLRARIEAALGKASGELITPADMRTLSYLSAPNAGISDLTGLESAANLTQLYLGWNNISDPSPLSGLTKLEELDLQSNNISNLSVLARLTNLEFLDIGSNAITDISPLSGLTKLTRLWLSGNRITDISPLSGLTNLTQLYPGWNNISDPSPLADLTKLKRLDLQSNNISNLSILARLTNLEFLSLGFNGITDISPLSGLTNLTELWMYGNGITDLAPVSDLTSLTTLIVWGNNITDISPLAGLVNVTWLEVSNNPITNLSPLGGLTNLKQLNLFGIRITDLSRLESWLPGRTTLERLILGNTGISDISLLAGLTNLKWLHLGRNNISDPSPLSGLTNLTDLWLFENDITDLSPLSGLTNLTRLLLGTNDITDVAALGGLVRLTDLDLTFNHVTDISALLGLTRLTKLDLRGNPLSELSINNHIPALHDRRVSVLFDSFRKGDYDIELVFSDRFTERQRRVFQYVARRWMAVIVGDLPDYEFTEGWSGTCGDQSYEIRAGERIDDLRIYMGTFEGGGAVGYGGPRLLRQETHLPVLGCMIFDLSNANLLVTGLHEIGHVLGFGAIWNALDFLQDPDGDAHFNGPLAITAFDEAGGSNYTGAKVPVDRGDLAHWRYLLFPDELMRPGGGALLSAITVQSLADLGYGVDVSQADAYTLPAAVSAQAVGAATTAIASIPGDAPLWEGMEGTRLGAARALDLRGNSLTGYPAPPFQASAALSCGLDLGSEPLRVIDRWGRVIRVIDD